MSSAVKSKELAQSRIESADSDVATVISGPRAYTKRYVTTSSVNGTSDNPLDDLRMRPRQVLVLVIALLLAALDGFDALSMSFVAPVLGREWHLTKDVLGLLLSSSLAGMAVGAVALSPLADKHGRRAMVLGAVALLTIGAGVSAVAGSATMLAAARFLTGIGIGLMVAMTTLISAEFTNVHRRSIAIAGVATMGFPIGGILGGLASSIILKAATWHWVFLTGSIAGVVLFVIVSLTLPESPAFLATRRAPDALETLNRVLSSLGQPTVSTLPSTSDRGRRSYRALFATEMRGTVTRLTVISILIATSSYYILTWLPQIVVDSGFTPAQGSFVSALSGMLGFVGGIGFAAFASRFRSTNVAAIAMTGAALALSAVGVVPPSIPLFVISAGVLSFCLAGTTGLLYAILAETFPPSLRASGMGFVMGVMRIASAAGPTLAGVMFAHGMTRAGVSIIFAIGPLLGAYLVASMRTRSNTATRVPVALGEA